MRFLWVRDAEIKQQTCNVPLREKPYINNTTYSRRTWRGEPFLPHFKVQQESKPHQDKQKAQVGWNLPKSCQIKKFPRLSLSKEKLQ